ncbi:uncharacterized protein LOC126678245 [Mercurialis annua]|uniref:uncharacterized protein LOC126678245 n=1 Tax=Mercurialis annua TaxID=3986 RepID=UPI00216025C1|nr:uncharacterized protein LOC126678245 [Mercurialis annua]
MKVALMWTINDFPAYSMLSGWSTSGRLACPHCMENTDAFTLKGSRKKSWFNCHRKFLPRGHMYRRNTTDFQKGKSLNKVFGQPKTGDELLAEVDRLGFMKAYKIGVETNNEAKSTDYDHAKSREELNDICDRPELAKDPVTGRFPKAICVDTVGLKMHGMKSHDCHIFIQRFLPIALRELLPKEVWEPLTELSIFFRELTSTSLTKKDLDRMRLEIPKILCKQERIFPPNFFDSMEHLPVHLLYIAMMAGLVQYHWMYPFERYLRKLKKKVRNKGRVEGSISNGYLNEETAKFAAYYFSEGDPMIPERPQRNEVCDIEVDNDVDRLSIFKPQGQSVGACRKRYLEDAEIVAARTYVLLNCSEIKNYREVFEGELRRGNPEISTSQIEVQNPTVCTNPFILSLIKGPLRSVRTFKGYRVNGFKFQTQAYGEEQLTMNNGVCVKGIQYVDSENDFYGVLTHIIELDYPSLSMKTTVLFKSDWFDPTQNSGTVSNKKYNMVDINNKKRYICRIKATSELDMPEGIIPSFQDVIEENPLIVATDDNSTYLADENGEAEEDALFVPPEETEYDFIASSSDEDAIEEL